MGSVSQGGDDWLLLGFIGLATVFAALYFWMFGLIVWLAYAKGLPVVTTILSGAIFGGISVFILRAVVRLIRKTREENRRKFAEPVT